MPDFVTLTQFFILFSVITLRKLIVFRRFIFGWLAYFMYRKNHCNIKYCFLLMLLLFSSNLFAQYDTQFSQYMLNQGTFNPGSIGEGEDMTVTLLNRQQWVNIDNAPSTFFLHAAIPKFIGNQRNGFGLVIMKESIGLFSTQLLQLQYAYKKPLFGGLLGIGLQGGMLQQNFDASGIHIPSSEYHVTTDLSIPTGTLEGKIPDFSAGIWFSRPRFYTGISASHLLESTIKLKENEETTDEESYKTHAARTYYLTGGYNILFANPLYTLQPSFLLKSDLIAWQADVSARLFYKERFWGIVGWRPEDAIILSAGIKLPQGLSIGYSYDISIKALSGVSGGSHEIFLSYSKKIETATVSKKQKSVRIL